MGKVAVLNIELGFAYRDNKLQPDYCLYGVRSGTTMTQDSSADKAARLQ